MNYTAQSVQTCMLQKTRDTKSVVEAPYVFYLQISGSVLQGVMATITPVGIVVLSHVYLYDKPEFII